MRDSTLFDDLISNVVTETAENSRQDALTLVLDDYWSALPFIENLFHIIDQLIFNSKYKQTHEVKQPDIRPWRHVCIGSDLDGFMDPIDICPTASHYPSFKEKLKYLIPIYLQERKMRSYSGQQKFLHYEEYFDDSVSLEDCLEQLFYESLRNFTEKYFNHPHSP